MLSKIRATDYNVFSTHEYFKTYSVLLEEILKTDLQFIEKTKEELRGGIILFEKFESKTILEGGDALIAHLINSIQITQTYLQKMEMLYDTITAIEPFSLEEKK